MTLPIRAMRPTDIAAGLALSRAASWNQVRADWEFFLANFTCLAATASDRLAGTCAIASSEGPTAWIAMLLVDPAFRRRSIATHLLTAALARVRCPTTGLDATAEGRPLYEKFGFAPAYEIVRWRRPPSSPIEPPREPVPCHWRPGHDSDHIGPLVAASVAEAANQVLTALARNPRRCWILDVPANTNPDWQSWLASTGFAPHRSFTRMFRGPVPAINPNLYATSGPEFPDL